MLIPPMLDAPSLETQANFIREVYKRNRPDEIRRMNEALEDPELDPKVKDLIINIRHEFKLADEKIRKSSGPRFRLRFLANGARTLQPLPNPSPTDRDATALEIASDFDE